MALPIFPSSPLPGGLSREVNWNFNRVYYDSGASQGFTAWTQPRYEWRVQWQNINETKQNTIAHFVNVTLKGGVNAFLMKDVYDYVVNSWMVASGATNGSTLQTYDQNSFHIRVDTTYMGSLTSTVSGFVTLGSEYSYDQDNGIITINTMNAGDIWSYVDSSEYFRKCVMERNYQDTSPIWNIFQIPLVIKEIV